MNVQNFLIEQLIQRFDTESNTQIAKRAGLSQPRFAQYKSGVRTMDDDAVIGCATALGIDPEPLVKRHREETARTSREKAFWRRMATAAALFLALGLVFTQPVYAKSAMAQATDFALDRTQGYGAMYIMFNKDAADGGASGSPVAGELSPPCNGRRRCMNRPADCMERPHGR